MGREAGSPLIEVGILLEVEQHLFQGRDRADQLIAADTVIAIEGYEVRVRIEVLNRMQDLTECPWVGAALRHVLPCQPEYFLKILPDSRIAAERVEVKSAFVCAAERQPALDKVGINRALDQLVPVCARECGLCREAGPMHSA